MREDIGGRGEERWTCESEEGNGNAGSGLGVKEMKCKLMIGETKGVVLREVGVWHDGSEPREVCGREG
jgi:hypothetical protein